MKSLQHSLLSTWSADQLMLGLGCLMALVVAGHEPIAALIQSILRQFHWVSAVIPVAAWLHPKRTRKRTFVEINGLKLSDDARRTHTHIVGATGTGKTVLMEQLILQDIERGSGAIIIDAKGERTFYDRLKRECRVLGRANDLFLLSATYPDESVIWNPCGLGGASELQSKFHQAAIYSEAYYEKSCENAYLKAFSHLANNSPRTFRLPELVETLRGLASDAKERKSIEGSLLDLENLALSEWGEVLGVRLQPGAAAREISLLDIVRERKILYVDLPTENKIVQSSRLGRLLLQELTTISGLMKSHPTLRSPHMFPVYIDEFDVFATPGFAVFLNKGRSSNFAIHIAHQALGDLERISPTFQKQILSNTNVRFIFRQDVPEDAETWSRFFGTKASVSKTWRSSQGVSTGESSNRDVLEFIVPPDEIKSMRRGHCIASVKEPAQLRRLRVPYFVPSMKPLLEERFTRRLENFSEGFEPHAGLKPSKTLSANALIAGFSPDPKGPPKSYAPLHSSKEVLSALNHIKE